MSVMERKYTAIGVAMAVVLAGFILGYRAMTSETELPAWSSNDRANHHPKVMTPSPSE